MSVRPADYWKKPKVSDVAAWHLIYTSPKVTVERAERLKSGTGWLEFYRVTVFGQRPKYFFGESAWMDARRLASDHDFNAWSIFD